METKKRKLALLSRLEKNHEWRKAESLLKKLLAREPDNHWLLTRLGSMYSMMGDGKKALKYIEMALERFPNCPLALWDFAVAKDILGRKREAIKIWKRLLRRGVESIAYGECGEGIGWARSLVNDCRCAIGLMYRDLGKKKLALRYLEAHLNHRKRGQFSLYGRKKLLERIQSLKS